MAYTAEELRRVLGLSQHPEGGFFAETFRDTSFQIPHSLLPSTFKVGRPVSTSIYFLLPSGCISRLHRIPSAEVWHFYHGDPLTVFEIDKAGNTKHTVLGLDLAAGQKPQYVVPPLVWFGAYPTKDIDIKDGIPVKAEPRDPEQHYSLVGCTVAPAFQFEDFELATRIDLVNKYPLASPFIELLTDP